MPNVSKSLNQLFNYEGSPVLFFGRHNIDIGGSCQAFPMSRSSMWAAPVREANLWKISYILLWPYTYRYKYWQKYKYRKNTDRNTNTHPGAACARHLWGKQTCERYHIFYVDHTRTDTNTGKNANTEEILIQIQIHFRGQHVSGTCAGSKPVKDLYFTFDRIHNQYAFTYTYHIQMQTNMQR